jgi:hypothetical protein
MRFDHPPIQRRKEKFSIVVASGLCSPDALKGGKGGLKTLVTPKILVLVIFLQEKKSQVKKTTVPNSWRQEWYRTSLSELRY